MSDAIFDRVRFLNKWIAIGRAIESLTDEEATSVTICNANPDFEGPSHKIECSGEWTGWQDSYFEGESLLECLEEAAEKKSTIIDRPEKK